MNTLSAEVMNLTNLKHEDNLLSSVTFTEMLLVTQPLYGPCQPPTPHLHPQPRGNSKLTGDQGHTERLFCQQSSS